jgi:two-component system cell cycle sensor histidine kinase/response regulator CckA
MESPLRLNNALSHLGEERVAFPLETSIERSLEQALGGSLPAFGRQFHSSAHECLDASETPLIRVLAVEDTASDLFILENALEAVTGVRFEVTGVTHIKEAAALLQKNQFDVVLTDLGLPDSTGLETFLAIQKAAKGLPVIVLTGLSDERMGIRAMREGAQDYFVKGHYIENGLIRAIRDAIERRKMEAAMQHDEERFRASIESLLDGFALLSPTLGADGAIAEFNVDYINESGLCLRPALTEFPTPFTLSELFPDSHATGLFKELVRVQAGGDPLTRECILLCHELANDLSTPSYDFRAARTGESIALSWRDVTPRLRFEAQVLQSQKMNSIGQLAGGIAHDFNNLLTVIHGYADEMKDSKFLPPQLTRSVYEISAAALRATNLTQQLLSFSRQHPLIATDIDMNDTVAQMSSMLGRILGESIHLQVEYRQPAPHVRGDRGMIEQVLLNLAVNSRDSMPLGGELSISTTVCSLEADEIGSEHDVTPGPFVCLTVRDNGSGIEADHLSKIFEPFFSTKEVGQGTGLGLATVYGVVKQHKGLIKVETKMGTGTVFRIYLPRQSAAPVASPAPLLVTSPSVQGNETILLVDDEDTIREMARIFLETHGYQVVEARDGVDALQIWQQKRGEIDLLLTDLVMPHGVSGQELAQQLQVDRPGLPVIYSSGYSPGLFGEGSFLKPETNFLQKPYRLGRLAELIRHCLDHVAA